MSESSPADPYTVRALDASTWDAFAELVERNGGVFGGCWCMGHHAMDTGESYRGQSYDKRATKQELVRTGRAHAALVFDAVGMALGWAKYGRLAEQPIIEHNRRAYEQALPPRPDWRITCYYTDTKRRRQGVAHGRFLFEMSVELYEEYGFRRVRQIGKHRWIVNRTIDKAEPRLRSELHLDHPQGADVEPLVRGGDPRPPQHARPSPDRDL